MNGVSISTGFVLTIIKSNGWLGWNGRLSWYWQRGRCWCRLCRWTSITIIIPCSTGTFSFPWYEPLVRWVVSIDDNTSAFFNSSPVLNIISVAGRCTHIVRIIGHSSTFSATSAIVRLKIGLLFLRRCTESGRRYRSVSAWRSRLGTWIFRLTSVRDGWFNNYDMVTFRILGILVTPIDRILVVQYNTIAGIVLAFGITVNYLLFFSCGKSAERLILINWKRRFVNVPGWCCESLIHTWMRANAAAKQMINFPAMV